MICVHLKELFQLCQENEIRLSSSDMVRVVCTQCGVHEVCPSALTSEFPETAAADELSEPPTSTEASPRSDETN
jgi:hypothetical protein